jgi:hypothetical protein
MSCFAKPVPTFAGHAAGGNQACLRRQPGNVGWINRWPEPIDERAGTRKHPISGLPEIGTKSTQVGQRVAVDQDQGGIHHTLSASISSYSEWVPKNRIARTCAGYCRRAFSPQALCGF